MRIFYSNVDTLTQTKEVELEAVTEVFPKINVNPDNSVYNIEGYTLHLENNSIRGTGIYIKTNFTYESLPTSTIFAEHTTVKFHGSITTLYML